ncbi:MAG TPA: hypothetical protein VF978_02675 [Gemmatimonadales bacterium]
MSRSPRVWSAMLCLFPVVACEDSAGPGVEPCTAANSEVVTLGVGEYTSVDAYATTGCIMFPANTNVTEVEYLIVPQAATGTPGRTLSFKLQGDAATLAAPPAMTASVQSTPGGVAQRFHEFLRRGEEARSWGDLRPRSAPAGAPAVAAAQAPKPVVGDLREFSVCRDLDCGNFTDVGARARAVGQRLAIFIDTLAPTNGLSQADLDGLITLFDSRLYAIDTAAFGRESDINQDSVVIVLMTNVVNSLVTAADCDANGAFVAGFFLGADIDPAFATDGRLNHAEIFYSIVADPSGTLSCAHSASQVTRFVPITFIHEFQHMISYNEHVLVRGQRNGEQLWLNEGLSHYAEELGGRSFLAEGDNQTFTDYVIGDLFNAYHFLEAPGDHFLLPRTGIGTLEERGAQWLYVRYLVDQYATDNTRPAWDVFTRRLVQTADTGASNVQAVTGASFATTVGRWALTNWVSDLPGFATPAELTYESWSFRSTFAQLNAQNPTRFPQPFPLAPTSSEGSAIDLAGTLRAGSGMYHRALHPAGALAFVLTFRATDGWALAPSHFPRLNVIRLR